MELVITNTDIVFTRKCYSRITRRFFCDGPPPIHFELLVIRHHNLIAWRLIKDDGQINRQAIISLNNLAMLYVTSLPTGARLSMSRREMGLL
jgi:hypothetical protein